MGSLRGGLRCVRSVIGDLGRGLGLGTGFRAGSGVWIGGWVSALAQGVAWGEAGHRDLAQGLGLGGSHCFSGVAGVSG
jgi:hypothetical protein